VLRDRVPPLRLGFPAPEAFEADATGALRAALVRLDPELEDLARVEGDFRAVPLDALRLPVELLPLLDLRAPPLREEEDLELEPVLALAVPSIVHLPDITR
jgi:hypothetical protein